MAVSHAANGCSLRSCRVAASASLDWAVLEAPACLGPHAPIPYYHIHLTRLRVAASASLGWAVPETELVMERQSVPPCLRLRGRGFCQAAVASSGRRRGGGHGASPPTLRRSSLVRGSGDGGGGTSRMSAPRPPHEPGPHEPGLTLPPSGPRLTAAV